MLHSILYNAIMKTNKKQIFIKLFKTHKGNVAKVCKEAKVSRVTYYRWLKDDIDFKNAIEKPRAKNKYTDPIMAKKAKAELTNSQPTRQTKQTKVQVITDNSTDYNVKVEVVPDLPYIDEEGIESDLAIDDKKKLFVRAYREHLANATQACKAIQISRAIYYKWLRSDPIFKAVIEYANEECIDFVESALKKNIQNGNVVAQIFYLKTKGRDRGYGDRVDFNVKENAKINLEFIKTPQKKDD